MPTTAAPPAAATLAALLSRHPATAGLFAAPLRADEFAPMPDKGVAHAHYRIAGHGLVLRLPRLSQWALPPAENLAYEAACFRRAEPAGATPRLAAVLPVGAELPRGALLVEEIAGRPPRLPEDLPRIAEALARLHRLTLPPPAARPPLADHGRDGPVAATLAVIERQRPCLDAAALPGATRAALEDELGWARGFAAASPPAAQPLALVGTDTHPGNFVIREEGGAQGGCAVLVDLEKAAYGGPAIDLAHASLVTSTRWDRDVQAVLTREQLVAFYRHYLALLPDTAAARLRPWLAPCRRLTWLRTMMWCVHWRVAVATRPEWSAAAIDPLLLAHIRRRVADFFTPEWVAMARREWLDAEPLPF